MTKLKSFMRMPLIVALLAVPLFALGCEDDTPMEELADETEDVIDEME